MYYQSLNDFDDIDEICELLGISLEHRLTSRVVNSLGDLYYIEYVSNKQLNNIVIQSKTFSDTKIVIPPLFQIETMFPNCTPPSLIVDTEGYFSDGCVFIKIVEHGIFVRCAYVNNLERWIITARKKVDVSEEDHISATFSELLLPYLVNCNKNRVYTFYLSTDGVVTPIETYACVKNTHRRIALHSNSDVHFSDIKDVINYCDKGVCNILVFNDFNKFAIKFTGLDIKKKFGHYQHLLRYFEGGRKPKIEAYEDEFNALVLYLKECYTKKFVCRMSIRFHPNEHYIITRVHTQQRVRVLAEIINVLKSSTPNQIATMIQQMHEAYARDVE